MGGTKFPTNDSLAQSKAALKEHQNVAKPKMIRPTVQPVYGTNSMPKFGSEFSADPLVQYLKKAAQESKVDSEGRLEDNLTDMKTGPEEQELVSHDPDYRRGKETIDEWSSYLKKMFERESGITRKYLDKDTSPTSGSVDRILKAGVKS